MPEATAAPRPPAVSREHWLRHYQVLLVCIDLIAASVAVGSAFALRFGSPTADEGVLIDLAYALFVPLAWVGVVAANRGYERRFVGAGASEFERIFRAFMHVAVLTVFVSYVTKIPLARGFVVLAIPLVLVLDLLGRYAVRKLLHRRRARGQSMTSVLAVGGAASVAQFTAMLHHDRFAGMRVVGACTPTGSDDGQAEQVLDGIGVPLLGDVDCVRDAARLVGAHSVAVLSGEIAAEKLRWISWQLEGTDTHLIVSPGLVEVGGRRLHIQPVAGLPMLHVDEPQFTGCRRMVKGAFDRCVAGAALLVLSPLLLAIGLLVRLGSAGPALFFQTRVGRDGRSFKMVKFRSMCADAEQRRGVLADRNEAADGLLFKIRDDPRITPIGRVLRRFSLDELPQLINVVTGSMSLVGPRPPLPAEVARYGDDVRRRLLVKPGLTGLWQISGRSDLSWDESVRLDLRYVENWSLALDVVVLWKTARVVLGANGAY